MRGKSRVRGGSGMRGENGVRGKSRVRGGGGERGESGVGAEVE